ncbi:MAG TPA: T9SS type A sorting domain-containing protein [Ferruginibacter sp.]|nr:T9SS type A sorting domain-containing protein [Ferruginibacter sp.]HPH91896.1 T9SS type A sorting domain-containing protein [Ferruginibacter sp.]
MKKNCTFKKVILTGLIFCSVFTGFSQSFTLSTWPTGDTISGIYTDQDVAVTFNIENTNDTAYLLTQVEMIFKYGNYTGTIPTLWYSASSLGDSSTISETNGWYKIATGFPLTILEYNFYPLFQNPSIIIPPNTQYRFAVQSTMGMRFDTYNCGIPDLYTTFTNNGIVFKVGSASSSPSANDIVGCVGMPLIQPFAFFGGRITLEPATTTPVTLLNFTATYNNKDANLIKWQTSQEINSSSFTLQKAYTLPLFTNVATLPAAGNSSTIKNYDYTDKEIQYKPTYYRLLQTDKDGKTAYSKTVVVTPYRNDFAIANLYPNPAHNNISIEYNSPVVQSTTFVICDVAGRQLLKMVFPSVKGFNKKILNTAALARGSYIIQVITEGQKIEKIFVKE